MCKFNPKNDSRRIDPCMKKLIENMNPLLNAGWKTVACCCGHGKYPMTIVLQNTSGVVLELCSWIYIERKKKFYKKDDKGYYYIPEVVE